MNGIKPRLTIANVHGKRVKLKQQTINCFIKCITKHAISVYTLAQQDSVFQKWISATELHHDLLKQQWVGLFISSICDC